MPHWLLCFHLYKLLEAELAKIDMRTMVMFMFGVLMGLVMMSMVTFSFMVGMLCWFYCFLLRWLLLFDWFFLLNFFFGFFLLFGFLFAFVSLVIFIFRIVGGIKSMLMFMLVGVVLFGFAESCEVIVDESVSLKDWDIKGVSGYGCEESEWGFEHQLCKIYIIVI